MSRRPRKLRLYEGAEVSSYASIGHPGRLPEGSPEAQATVVLGRSVQVGPQSAIGAGVRIGAHTIVDQYSNIGPGTRIGRRAMITGRCQIGPFCSIADDCVVGSGGSMVGGSCIGPYTRVFGSLANRFLAPADWDEYDPRVRLDTPIIGSRVVVGNGSLVIGSVVVGDGAYICAGATVTQDVPPGIIVRGVNDRVHPSAWPSSLGMSRFFGRQ